MPDHVDPNPGSIPTADGPLPERTNTFTSEGDHTDGEEPSHIDPTTFLAPKQKPDELGRLGPYRVLKLLGKGGMGFVFLAEDEMLERKIALKVMRPDVAVKANAKERFLREGRAAAKVKHEHVITIHAVGEERGMPFLALEFLEGMPLDQYLKSKGEIDVSQAIRIIRETVEGLRAAHKHGLIHRDIKPANVWLEAPSAHVKVLDFGLARQEKENTHLTQSGAVVGTPAYMSPEQARGVAIDGRSDFWSVGVMLYRLCTGRMPFEGETTLGVLTAIAVDQPPPPRQLNPKLPPALEQIIQRLLQKKPEQRYQSADELIAALNALEKPVTATGPQQVVYVPMAVPAEANPFAGIDDSDYTNPMTAKSSQASSPLPKTTPKHEASPQPHRGESPGPQRDHAPGSVKKTRLLIFGIAILALAVGGYFTFRSGNKDEPKPDATVKNNDPSKIIKDDPPPKKIDSSTTPVVKGNEISFDLGNGIKLEVVKINAKGKTFLMGSPKEEEERGVREEEHEVTFDHDYYLGKYEVTQEQFDAMMGTNPSKFQGPKNPVEMVSWNDAREFCKKLNERFKDRKVTFRLPSEAEWEYACRAGTRTAYYFGETIATRQANFQKIRGQTCAVGSYEANALGLHDMHGNVAEWCEDIYGPYSRAPSNGTAQTVKQSVDARVRRGGSWNVTTARYCRSSRRSPSDPTHVSESEGFRVAVDITDDSPVLLPLKK